MNHATKEQIEKMKIGTRVFCAYHENDASVIREITHIEKDSVCGSGYRASASAGLCECCKKCKATFGSKIVAVDASWFIPVSAE